MSPIPRDVTIDSTTGNQYLYDGEGRVCAVESTSAPGFTTMTGYIYDADGNRVAKGTITSLSCDTTQNGFQPGTDYVLGPGGEPVTELAEDSNGTMNWQRTYVYAGSALIGTYDPNPDTPSQPLLSFRLTDWVGTMRATTDANGVAQGACAGLPFGDGQACQGNIPDPHYFTGKERDPETGGPNGNDYFGARYYASSMARWLSPDWSAKVEPVPYAKMDDPQSLNLYAYVGNNPLTTIDPDGHGGSGCQSSSAQVGSCQKQSAVNKGGTDDGQGAQKKDSNTQTPTQSTTDPAPPLKYDMKQPVPPLPAAGPILPVLQCMQSCSSFVISSTAEDTPRHPPGTPHRLNEAADLEVGLGKEHSTLQCAANCGAHFGLDERAHPSKNSSGPHVHVQVTPGRNGGRGDLPLPND
jgi:RHS repeat-associated protein